MIFSLIECPRDAMQGLNDFIPTSEKVSYLNKLLKVGFDSLDFGSFVSPKSIPQLKDTTEVLKSIDHAVGNTKLLAIVANQKGAVEACKHPQITYLGYPFSVSETFQLRNTKATIAESLQRVIKIQELCLKHQKKLVIYISMGFGNPYGDEWSPEIVAHWVDKMVEIGIEIISLSDTVGVASAEDIKQSFSTLIPKFASTTFGAHLHTRPEHWRQKVVAAWEGGCHRFDGAIKGYGGCPMASDQLTGNMPTEFLVDFANEKQMLNSQFNHEAFNEAMQHAAWLFNRYH